MSEQGDGASGEDVLEAQGYMDANQGKVDRGAVARIAARYHETFMRDGELKPDVEERLRAELKPVCGGFLSEEDLAVLAVTSPTGDALDNPAYTP